MDNPFLIVGNFKISSSGNFFYFLSIHEFIYLGEHAVSYVLLYYVASWDNT